MPSIQIISFHIQCNFQVLASRGAKNVLQGHGSSEKESVSVLVTVSAAGETLPEMVILPYKRIPANLLGKLPDPSADIAYGRSDNGWMTATVLYEYLANSFNKWVEENDRKKPVILFTDLHESRLDFHVLQYLRSMEILLIGLPPNTTHLMQPLDVSVFGPLKADWTTTAQAWQREHVWECMKREDMIPLFHGKHVLNSLKI